MRVAALVMLLCVQASSAWAQADWTPPPLVPVPEGPPQALPPPPPTPPVGQQTPPSQPAGPTLAERNAPEVGLMVSEALFGMLTAAGVCVLPYFLFDASGLLTNNVLGGVVLIGIFSAVPLAVAQTQTSIANGSRWYYSEMWPAALAGLAGQAAVLGLFYATGWLPSSGSNIGSGTAGSGVPKASGSAVLLLLGSALVVPLLQMAVVNLTKQPKFRTPEAPRPSVAPSLAPMVSETRAGPSFGVQLGLSGSF